MTSKGSRWNLTRATKAITETTAANQLEPAGRSPYGLPPPAWRRRRAHPAREIDRRIVNLRGLEALDHPKQMDRHIMEA
jgi:hypothetical protein